jgi:4-diphosphocytidyl-2-C-methyl-D-erythritol kinase
VLGSRPDGYHELRTTFQSIALHDTIEVAASGGGFSLTCDDPRCPIENNLIERAAGRLWREAGHRAAPPGIAVRLQKRIPVEAGLGGGSSDAAATLRALNQLWQLGLDDERLSAIGRELGADVPFFFHGGTMLGLERGDLLFRLADWPPAPLVVAFPGFGVSTREAFGWFDRQRESDPGRPRPAARPRPTAAERRLPPGELVNDLQPAVAARHPAIARIVSALVREGASHAAMTGSGSTVFGVFESAEHAATAAQRLTRRRVPALVTRMISRAAYQRLGRPEARPPA